VNNKISFSGEERHKVADIFEDSEQTFWLRTNAPVMVDASHVVKEARLAHCSKIVFMGKMVSKDGSHIVITVFSKEYNLEKGTDTIIPKSIFQPKRASMFQKRVPMETRILNHKWNFEEREHMKKFLLVFGYGRWDKIKEASREACVHFDAKMQMGLCGKEDREVKAFANAFIRAICDNFCFERYELKMFLLNVIEESPSDPYVPVNSSTFLIMNRGLGS
jgi:hypothetical protein